MAERPAVRLASASARRATLLAAALAPLGIRPEVAPTSVDESPFEGEAPEALATRLAVAKARAAGDMTDRVVVAADTVIDRDGVALGTPATPKDAAAMLEGLLGRRHRVVTAVAVARGGTVATAVAVARVTLASLDAPGLQAYVESDLWRGKAGGYGLQDPGTGLVEAVEGDPSGVIGLPLRLLAGLLAACGWNPAG